MKRFEDHDLVYTVVEMGTRRFVSTKDQSHSLAFGLVLLYFTVISISSKVTGPTARKFHIDPPEAEELKVCSNSPGHMTNMAATSIYGKKIKSSEGPID